MLDRWTELYDHGPLAHLTLDGQGLVQDVNQAAAALLGPSSRRRHLSGSRLRRCVREGDHEILARHLTRCAGEAGPSCCELHLLDGTPVQIWSRRIRPGLRTYPTALIDLSARERADDETRRLTEAEKAARQSMRAKDQFIASLSHELRTPLTPVLAAVTALHSRADVPPALRGICEMIRRNVQTEARLIDDLLDVSRITQGKMSIDRQPTDAHAAVREVIETLEADIRGKRISVGLFLEADRPIAFADPVRLKQVLWNLMRNAVKFTPEGGRIEVRSWNDDRGGRTWLHVEVSDNGLGFDPASVPRLFEAFEQGTEKPERNGGLGLGLAICKGIMDLHAGTIAATSPGPGRGARFLIEIDTMAAAPVVVPAHTPLPGPGPAADRPRLLLVEDDPDTADVLQELLQDAGYVVRIARSAKAALALDLDTIDLVISDIGLPDVSGLDLMRRLKDRALRGVALSGYGTEADILASREAGFSAHLTKPVDFERLLATIQRVSLSGFS